jgi:hypothetical protein
MENTESGIPLKDAATCGNCFKLRHIPNITIGEVLGKLEGGKYINEHYQSQLWRLTPSPGLHKPPIPMHFIGKIETWAESWSALLDLLEQRAGVNASKLKRRIVRKKQGNSRSSSSLFQGEINALPELKQRIERLYNMDFACFGYPTALNGAPLLKTPHAPNLLALETPQSDYNWRGAPWVVYANYSSTAAFKGTV